MKWRIDYSTDAEKFIEKQKIHLPTDSNLTSQTDQNDEINVMEDFKIYYDEEEDILYLAREGREQEVVELSPWINLELDATGQLMGVEIFRAPHLFKDVIKVMEKRLQAA